jgi:hypothetical protein
MVGTVRARQAAAAGVVVLAASWQVTLRSEDPNATALANVLNVVGGTGGDLSQYRPLSAYLALGISHLFGLGTPPFLAMRFVQCLLIFGLAYVFYAQLGLTPRLRLIGIALVAGLASLQLGTLGPSSFSLDRFNDAIFYLVAGILVLKGKDIWLVPLIAIAIANRETAVFIPALILAQNRRRSTFVAGSAWAAAAVVYFAIHLYYGPHPRTEDSYFGPDMFLRSLRMAGQTAYLLAAVNLLPLLVAVLIKDVDPFLRRLFWMVVPLWFAIHIWAARMGEGIMYLAPLVLIVVPLVLQGLQRHLERAARSREESLLVVELAFERPQAGVR